MGSISNERTTRFVDSIYEASVNGSSEGWTNVFEEFSQMVSSGPGSLALHSASDDRFNVIASTVDPSTLKNYFDHYQYVSPFRKAIVNLKPGEVFSRRKFIADDVYLKSSYYNEFSRRQGVYELEHYALFSQAGITGSLSLTRPIHRPDFSRDERRLVDIGVRHLQRAFRNFVDLQDLRSQNQLLTGVLDSAGCAVFVVDSKLRVSYSNMMAEMFLRESDLVRLSRTGEIAFRSRRATKVLQIAANISNEIGRPDSLIPSDVVIGKNSNGERIILKIAYSSTFPIDGITSGRRLILYLHGLLEPTNTVDQFAHRHGLTLAETRLLELLIAGYDLKAICTKLEVSINTVRTHLKHIFAKTGKRRQADLIRCFIS